jgi:glutathione synthase/RimK-type ligase-like ATP-grasp enzyme
VSARRYLTDPSFVGGRSRVFNLCRSYRYQSLGYYVSLLAEARGHRPLPSVTTIQDLKSQSLVRFVTEELDDVMQHSLARIESDHFTLSVYFGRNMAERHRRLALQLFNLFPAPLLRAQMERIDDTWELSSLKAIAVQDVAESQRPFVAQSAREFFAGRGPRKSKPRPMRYDLAVLVDEDEESSPSNERAIKKICKHAEKLGLRTELIGRDDFGRLAGFDALFVRATTAVDHYTYRFARRAAAEGLVVIDDPVSILRCTNKVFLAELLQRAGVPMPRTVVVHRDNLEEVTATLGLPVILKLPDGSFSRDVVKASTTDEFRTKAKEFLEDSDLVIAQEFLPTDFDWRIGLLDGKPLFAARYGMARGHWQIAHHGSGGKVRYGDVEAIALESVPKSIVDAAVRAGALIGDGFYGVDVKEVDGKPFVIEVNDNPNLDAGCEDEVLGDELYVRLMSVFLERIEKAKLGKA